VRADPLAMSLDGRPGATADIEDACAGLDSLQIATDNRKHAGSEWRRRQRTAEFIDRLFMSGAPVIDEFRTGTAGWHGIGGCS
jgi:hypothetical protein